MGLHNGALAAGILALVLSCSGCGTLIHGTTQEVMIETEPTGASITIPGSRVRGLTSPAVVELARGRGHLIIVKKVGYETKGVYIHSELEPLSLVLDILLGGIGILIDWPWGGLYELRPDEVFVALTKEKAG